MAAREKARFGDLWFPASALCLAFSSSPAPAQPRPTLVETRCKTLPDDSFPVLRWCETDIEFRYEILTWKEEIVMDKQETLRDVKRTLQNFLEDECRSGRLEFEKAFYTIWLHIPFYGAETATPRLALRIEGQDREHNLLFGQGPWQSGWKANHENMAILGSNSYSDFDGYAYFGFKPEKSLIFELPKNSGMSIPIDLEKMLQSWGVTRTERHHPSKPRYIGWTKIYEEEATLKQILGSSEAQSQFSYIEANAYWEGAGNHVLLHNSWEPIANCESHSTQSDSSVVPQ